MDRPLVKTTGILVKSRDSLLTTDSGYTNYRGILNLVIILLFLSNARAALENVIKYGILVDPLSWFQFFAEGSKHWPSLLISVSMCGHIGMALAVEKVLAVNWFSNHPHLIGWQPEATTPTKTTTNNTRNHNNNNNHQNNSPTSTSTSLRQLKKTKSGDDTKQQSSQNNVLSLPATTMTASILLITNLMFCIGLPPLVIVTNDCHPISTSLALMLVSIVFLKLVSYHMINFWCRDIRLPEKEQSRTTTSFLRSYMPPSVEFGLVSKEKNQTTSLELLAKYPTNLTIADMYQYMSFPTLCYELEFARTRRIRKRFLIKRLVELVILSQLDLALVQQWIIPTVENSLLPLRQMQFSHMLERLLKLAIPNHIIWLIWFYLFFHSFLNIVAELSRFADREFYRDWWNSESVYYFWSNWNVPVHKWCARHLYVPTIALGLTKCQASTVVFCVSAFFHEYLVSVPLKLFRAWAFLGMLCQLPWARFVSSYFNSQFANVAVWVSLIIGQPLCILMYYHDYYVIHHSPQRD